MPSNSFRDPAYADIAKRMEAKHGLPSGLLYSIVTNGERSNQDQVSSAGARSIAQIIPSTRDAFLRKYGVDAYLSPENALEVAALHLKEDLDRTGGDVPEAVASYIAGPTGRNRGPQTSAYVQRVVGGLESAAPKGMPIPPQTLERYNAGQLSPEQVTRINKALEQGSIVVPEGSTIAVRPSVEAKPNAVEMSPEQVERFNSQSTMTDAQREVIERNVKLGYIRPPEGVTLQRPAARTAADYGGMAVRSVGRGVGQLADFGASALTGFSDIPGMPSATAGADRVADALNLATPGTPGEKLLGSVIEGGTQGVLTAGVGPVAGLGGRMAVEAATGAAATGGMEAARQAGAPAAVQLGVGLATGIGGFAAAKAIEGIATRSPRAAQILERTPPSALVDEAGQLTDDGIEAAVHAEMPPDEFKAAIDEVRAARVADEAEAPVATQPEAQPRATAQEAPGAPSPAAAPEAPRQGVEPATAGARAAEAQSEGVTLSRGQAEKDFNIQEAEQSLRVGSGREAEQARAFFLQQADDIQAATTRFREAFGDTAATAEERGQLLKDSLRDLRDSGKAGVDAMYAEARSLAEQTAAKAGDNSAALLDLDTGALQGRLKELLIDQVVPSETRDALRQLGAQYGLIGKGAKTFEDGATFVDIPQVGGTASRQMQIPRPQERLSVTNAENFRKDVNDLFRQDTSGRSQSLKGIIDNAVETAIERAAIEGVGNVGQAFKGARKAFQEQKKTFSAKDIVQRLIDWKKGAENVTELVSPSQGIREVFKDVASLRKLKTVLLSSPTEASKNAWKAIQAHGVADIFEKALVVNANQGAGAISGAKLNSAINKFGPDKLKVLLDPAEFDQLMKLRRVIGDATIPLTGTTNPSGTANKIIRFLGTQTAKLTPLARAVPVVGGLIDAGSALMKQGAEAAQATKTLEGIRSYRPPESAAAEAPKADNVIRPAQFVRDFIKIAGSDEIIAPILAAGASASEP